MSSPSSVSRRRHRRASSALFLVLGFHVGVWAVQLGGLAAALRLDPAALGVALSGGAIGGVITLLLGGRLSDRFGRRRTLLIGFGVAGVAFLGLAAARTFPEAAALVVLYGLSISFVDLGANAVGTDFEHAYDVDAMTGLQAGFSLGATAGALLSALLLAAGVDYCFVYAGLGLVFLLAAVVATRADLPERVPPGADAAVSVGGVWREAGVLFATMVLLVVFFGDGALEGFLAVFLRRALASGVLLSGTGIAGFHLASLAGRTVADALLRRFGVRRVIAAAGLLEALGIAAAVLAPAAWASIAGLLLVGFAISPVVPSAISLAGRSAPGRSGRAVAFTTAVGYASFLVGPLVVGGVASATSLRTGMALVVVTALALAVLGTRWPRTRRGSEAQEPAGSAGDRWPSGEG